MRFPPDQFLSALRAVRCPEGLLGQAMRVNTFGVLDVRAELLLQAWHRALEVEGRDVEMLLPDHAQSLLSGPPPVLDDPDLTRAVVADELWVAGAGLSYPSLTPGQRRVLRGYAGVVERAYREFWRREVPGLRYWQAAVDVLEGR